MRAEACTKSKTQEHPQNGQDLFLAVTDLRSTASLLATNLSTPLTSLLTAHVGSPYKYQTEEKQLLLLTIVTKALPAMQREVNGSSSLHLPFELMPAPGRGSHLDHVPEPARPNRVDGLVLNRVTRAPFVLIHRGQSPYP